MHPFNEPMIVDPNTNGVARVARTYTLTALRPSSVNFYYNDTIFRVEVPIGTSFDAVNPNEQLVPSLCDEAVLRNDGESGPNDGFTETVAVEKDNDVALVIGVDAQVPTALQEFSVNFALSLHPVY